MQQQEYVWVDFDKLYLAAQKKEILLTRLAIQCGYSKNFWTCANIQRGRVNKKAAEKAEEILGVSLIVDKAIWRKNKRKPLKIKIAEQKEKIIDCMLENLTPYETAKLTEIDVREIEKIYYEEDEACERERERRRRIRPAIIRTSSGLMYTR